MSKHASPTVIGSFVVTALVLALGGILVFGGNRYFRDTADVIVYFDGSVAGLRVGGPVKFRGIEIGRIKDIRINMTGAIADPQHIRIPVLLELDEDKLSEHGVRAVDLDRRERLDRLIGLGLRAQLATESLVTGVRYVELDIRPNTPVVLSGDREYPEIPSLRGLLEAIPDKANEVLTRISNVDFVKLTDSLQAVAHDASALLRSPEVSRSIARIDDITKSVHLAARDLSQTVRDLRPAIAKFETLATSTNKLVSPGGGMAYRIDSTLRDVQGAAQSLRRLADQLSRDPGAIVRGGKP